MGGNSIVADPTASTSAMAEPSPRLRRTTGDSALHAPHSLQSTSRLSGNEPFLQGSPYEPIFRGLPRARYGPSRVSAIT